MVARKALDSAVVATCSTSVYYMAETSQDTNTPALGACGEKSKGVRRRKASGEHAATEDDGYPESKRIGLLPAVVFAAGAVLTLLLWTVLIWIVITVL
jgi:hypothetical protein